MESRLSRFLVTALVVVSIGLSLWAGSYLGLRTLGGHPGSFHSSGTNVVSIRVPHRAGLGWTRIYTPLMNLDRRMTGDTVLFYSGGRFNFKIGYEF